MIYRPLIFMTTLIYSAMSFSQALPDANDLIKQVNSLDEGQHVIRNLHMKLTDRRGKVRERDTISMRKYYGQDKKTIIFYLSPKNVKDTAFLTFDYDDSAIDDDQWLYLPAMRKTRRISASDRGDYFLGTDLTYEDIKKEGKIAAEDYTFTTLGTATIDGHKTYQVEAKTVSKETAKELGHSRLVAYIDPEINMIRMSEYWDINGNKLKTLNTKEIKLIDGILTRHLLEVENHKTGHRTVFTFRNVDYQETPADDLFSERAIKRGWQ